MKLNQQDQVNVYKQLQHQCQLQKYTTQSIFV